MTPFSCTVPRGTKTRQLLLIGLLFSALLLSACGFRLKGVTPLPFDTIYTNIAENSSFGAAMRRAIKAASPNTRFVNDPSQAQVRLLQLANNENLRELAIDAEGRVEEYELNLEFVFQLVDAQGRELLPPTALRATREVPYDDSMVQAKQIEITTIFMQMQQSMVNRVVRHLTAPDVAAAYRNASHQPQAEVMNDLTPISNDPTPSVTEQWGAPSMNPLAGMQ